MKKLSSIQRTQNLDITIKNGSKPKKLTIPLYSNIGKNFENHFPSDTLPLFSSAER